MVTWTSLNSCHFNFDSLAVAAHGRRQPVHKVSIQQKSTMPPRLSEQNFRGRGERLDPGEHVDFKDKGKAKENVSTA